MPLKEFRAPVFFKSGLGAPTSGMVITVGAGDNYAVVKSRINELVHQSGAPKLANPEIHVTLGGKIDRHNRLVKMPLKGNATLRSIGVLPKEAEKKVDIKFYVDLPPEPDTGCCIIL